MPRLKEARFFSYDGRGSKVKFPIQTLEEYTALFEVVTPEERPARNRPRPPSSATTS